MPDVIIQLIIPEDKMEEFRVHFLLAAPKRRFEGTDLEWIKHLLRSYCINLYRKGKDRAAEIDYQDVIPLEGGI